jgi:hypothetical protein
MRHLSSTQALMACAAQLPDGGYAFPSSDGFHEASHSSAAGILVSRKHSKRSTAALAFVLAAFLAMNMALFGFLLWRKQQVIVDTDCAGQRVAITETCVMADPPLHRVACRMMAQFMLPACINVPMRRPRASRLAAQNLAVAGWLLRTVHHV